MPVRGFKYWSILGSQGQWAVWVFSVPHLLWHGTSDYLPMTRGTYTCCWELSIPILTTYECHDRDTNSDFLNQGYWNEHFLFYDINGPYWDPDLRDKNFQLEFRQKVWCCCTFQFNSCSEILYNSWDIFRGLNFDSLKGTYGGWGDEKCMLFISLFWTIFV